MGTNFYGLDQHRGREHHLGKRSFGWVFCFQATEDFGSVRELIGWLETRPVEIVDEYGQKWDCVEWIKMATQWGRGHDEHLGHTQPTRCGALCPACVESFGGERRNEHIHGPVEKHRWWAESNYIDEGGHHWCEVEFS